ncbi:uncharacterized protein LOC106536234, partial [Austrofundulus limnaeus]|uniref:Uncharacterized protein LOC106536234 n=1 Tax=Austrofundulus limnaeus TaxID=52670 RepID=A0A2I4D9I4_AUSLI
MDCGLQDCVSALYASLGLSAGGEFSSQDVSFLFDKVFHVSSNTDEARAAMKKVAGGDKSWSCSGENVLDVLIEMERERERKEMLYWNFQLLNTGNLPHLVDRSHPSDADIFKNTPDSDSRSIWPHTTETAWFLTRGVLGEKKLGHNKANVRRLKKAAGHSWALLASLGVRGLLPSPWQGPTLGIQSQAWGCVSLSDVLLLVEVKYDAVAHLLYREMLQEHHTESVWEKLSPWQQHQEVEVLEEIAEEALESVDLLGLAVLPGAFRIYKMCPDASSRNCSELRNQSWSAVSLLNDLHTFRKQEQITLTALGQRLCGESLRSLCLYIRLATYRAQREKISHFALLAARQSWDSWPCVVSPCSAEQVALWFHGREEENEAIRTPEQQTELQLLVWVQEQERKQLLSVLRGISVEDLHEPDSGQTSLRAGCLRRLRQIHAQLQKQRETQTPSKHTNFQTLTQGEWSQVLLDDCAMLLLTHLIELQEVQASFLLQELLDRNTQGVQVLQRKYEAELEAQRFTNLLHLLVSDDPLTPGFMTENTHKDL